MSTAKASVDEIRARFDKDVERFSNLDTGQMTTQDAALVLDIIACAAARVTPGATRMADLGCGAGNFSLRLAAKLPLRRIVLADLSANMLARAAERLREAVPTASVEPVQIDIRALPLEDGSLDLIAAAAVLHHLREEHEWDEMFSRAFRALRPGGALWIWDFIEHDIPGLQEEMWQRYGDYLESLKGPEYRRHVLEYVSYEDSPRSTAFQLRKLEQAGFVADVVHKNGCFAAICAVKRGDRFTA